MVKYYKPSTLHNMTLTDECLDRIHLEFMKYIEGKLRCKKNKIDQDLVTSDLLYAFRLNRAVDISKTSLKRETRFYMNPVFALKEDGTEGVKVVSDS